MPAKSKKQQGLMAVAEHEPDKITPQNQGVVKMTKSQLHDFATTDKKGLPIKVKKEKKHTTTIKHDSGPAAPKDQQKQIRELI
jgi:hypothetical protein